MKKILIALITFFLILNIKALELNSKYVYVYNDTENQVMYELNSNEEIKVASMTKIMTAIIVIENNSNLEKLVTIEDSDLKDMYEYTTVGFQAGDRVTIKELLYGILLRSGSDAVNAAVRVTSGGLNDFVDLMNQKVSELNLKNTYFSNAIGKDEGNYSSVHDIAMIMEYCLKNETFKEIISTPMYYIDRLDLQINGPLYKQDIKYNLDLSLISGSKSGYTGLAKHSLVSYGNKDNVQYIVVTDYANSFKELLIDNSTIYEYFYNNYSYKKYKINFDIDIENSEDEKYNVDINTLVYLNNDYDENLLSYKYNGKSKITYLNKKGSKLGKVSIYYNNELIKEIDVKLNKTINYKVEAYHMPIFIVIIIIIFIVLLIIRVLLKRKKKIKKKINKVKYQKVKTKKVENKKIEEVKSFIKEENSLDKKMNILKNTTDINLFFNTLKSVDDVDKELLEKNLIDRCFQNINFENEDELKDLYTKIKLYKKDMSAKTIKYYNKLFKYCIEKYINKN